ncbi:hypothetical protein JCM12178A_32870 [Salidesulfovibrio brasiliensis]
MTPHIERAFQPKPEWYANLRASLPRRFCADLCLMLGRYDLAVNTKLGLNDLSKDVFWPELWPKLVKRLPEQAIS